MTRNPSSFSCLIVEDDRDFAPLVAQVVSQMGGQPTLCATLDQMRQALQETRFDLLLLDNHLPDGRVYDVFANLSRRQPGVVAMMITGAPDLGEAVALTRNGLFDYLTKPLAAEVLEAALRRALLALRPSESAAEPRLGDSPAMRAVLRQLRQAARHRAAVVLLTGESGVGKDVCARALHQFDSSGSKPTAPYIPVNCAALPADMFEAELFGAERGAYTGADRRRQGLVEAAQEGTLFLDEIGEVPLALQPKLLRFLENREFRSLGSTQPRAFTGRVVAATNRDLRAEVEAGRFREDLFFRLEVVTVVVPPLRERRDDLPGLAADLLAMLCRKYERNPVQITPEDLRALLGYDFPGNVRELRNLLERSLLYTPEDGRWLVINPAWMPGKRSSASLPPAEGSAGAAPTPVDALPPERTGLTPLEAQEYRLIRQALVESRGGIRRAAGKLGLSPQALLRRLEKWPELRQPGG